MGPSPNALKYQVIGTLHAAAYMRGGSGGGSPGDPSGLPCRCRCCCCQVALCAVPCELLTGVAPHACPAPAAVPLIVMNTLVVFVKLVFG